jgi:integrase
VETTSFRIERAKGVQNWDTGPISGLALTEVVGNTKADVTIKLQRGRTLQRDRKAKTWQTTPPKTKFGVRDVPLAATLAQRLWQARSAAGNPPEGASIFVGPKGGPFDAVNGFNRVLKPAARPAGVPWAGWHTLRHTCAANPVATAGTRSRFSVS